MGWSKQIISASKLLFISLLCLSLHSYADTQRIIEYGYDGAGNIISISSTRNLNSPVISDVSPNRVRINSNIAFTATGTDLNNTHVTTDHVDLVVSNVNTAATTITFELDAANSVPLGQHTLTFTTLLGSVTALVEVVSEIPTIMVLPSPLTLEPGGEVITLDVFFTASDIVDQTLSISIPDPNIATVNVSSITILAGQTSAAQTIQITSNNLGFTSLDITTPDLVDGHVNLFVTDRFVPGVGTHTTNAKPISLFIPSAISGQGTTQISPLVSPVLSVNVADSANEDVVVSPVVSPVLSVLISNETTTTNLISPVVTPVISILKEETP